MIELAIAKIIFLTLGLVVTFKSSINSKRDIFAYILIVLVYLVEILDHTIIKSNTELYSIFQLAQALLLGFFIFSFSGIKWIIIVGEFLVFGVYFITNVFNITFHSIYYESPIDKAYLPFFKFVDLATVSGLTMIVFSFTWLYSIINSTSLDRQLRTKQLIYIFGLLIFFGGSFFTLMYSRLLLPNVQDWTKLWISIITPLYFTYYSLLFIGLSWKTSPSS